MSSPDTVENFFGVYLLFCKNPQYIGRTYIGYTVDPNRRIKQHNKGAHAGGARRTSKRGPWSMVLIVHGFPNDISALRFEWAWQHPTTSRRLKNIPKKRSREKSFEYLLRILEEMLRTGPWNRLPLTIRWLDESFKISFAIEKGPPIHMPIIGGAVISKKVSKPGTESSSELVSCYSQKSTANCTICFLPITNGSLLKCIRPECSMTSHLICLSQVWLKSREGTAEWIPVDGDCPKCKENFLWGDLIRKMKGCYQTIQFTTDNSSIDLDVDDSDEENL